LDLSRSVTVSLHLRLGALLLPLLMKQLTTATTGAAGASRTTDAIALPSTVGTPLVVVLQ
jgi:hypothetical protein